MERSVAVEAGSTWVLIVSSRIDASRIDAVTDARRSNTCNDLGLREPRA
jgi:hypothetical protein